MNLPRKTWLTYLLAYLNLNGVMKQANYFLPYRWGGGGGGSSAQRFLRSRTLSGWTCSHSFLVNRLATHNPCPNSENSAGSDEFKRNMFVSV
jgi:hypothetical protein